MPEPAPRPVHKPAPNNPAPHSSAHRAASQDPRSRVMGIETEYGIAGLRPDGSVNTDCDLQDLSARLIWERGVSAHAADPQSTNRWLTNGARWYVDHGHPEYSSPEVCGAVQATVYDCAGERIMASAARSLARQGQLLGLYKNNVDGKGASYGTHENYCVDRAVPWDSLVAYLTPFLVTRQVFAGAGRVGLGQASEQAGFQISQRADYIELVQGLATTARRAIVNTRDEPLASRTHYRRLHLIIGDANCFPTANWLKMGTTSYVLWLIEHMDCLDQLDPSLRLRLDALALANPVEAVQQVSRDLTLRQQLPLLAGSTMSALDIQQAYAALVRQAWDMHGRHPDVCIHQPDACVPDACDGMSDADADACGHVSDVKAAPLEAMVQLPDAGVEASDAVLDRWESVLGRLSRDPLLCAREVEWVAKHHMLDAMRLRLMGQDAAASAEDYRGWDHPRLAAMDIMWSNVDRGKGLAHRLDAAGLVNRDLGGYLVDKAVVDAAADAPPANTRAAARARLLHMHLDPEQPVEIQTMDWDKVTVRVWAQDTLSAEDTLTAAAAVRTDTLILDWLVLSSPHDPAQPTTQFTA